MKKYFLKGKAYIHQKMGQLDIQHDKLDLVAEQTPKKFQQTFKILSSKDIDLQSFEKYSPYYRTYPNHPIAPLLFDKIKHQTKIMEPSYIQQIRVQKNKVPMIDEDLEEKAYKLRNIVEGYNEGFGEVADPLLGIGLVQFHHKRGAEVEFVYPKNQTNEAMFSSVIPFAMPDSSHNKMQDCSFFNLIVKVGGTDRMVYGISYFKQKKITEEMKKNNPQLTRSHLQKSICILSFIPLFGELRLKIMGITESYFDNLSQYSIISGLYDEIKADYQRNWRNISLTELHIGVDCLSLLTKFKSGLLNIFKAILFNKKVILYSQSAYSSGSAILSMLSLFPGQLAFTLRSTVLDKYIQGLREYALPLKIFSTDQPLMLSANIQVMNKLKSLPGGFVIGTSNQMLIQSLNHDLLVDLDKNELRWNKQFDDQQLLSSKDDKVFVGVLNRMLKQEQDTGQNWIKDHFHNYLKTSLAKIADVRYRYNQFIYSCRCFQDAVMYAKKDPRNQNYRNYQKFDDDIRDQNDLAMKVPEFNQSLLQIPLMQMIHKPYFRYFLEFSHPQLYLLTNNYYVQDFLIIDNFEYYLGSLPRSKSKYVSYNYKTKKLRISNLQLSQKIRVKQLKFNENLVSEIFIGDYDGPTSTYNGQGILINALQLYEGGFKKGMKDGFGKLVSNALTYIGTFSEGLYHGDGHLIINQSNTIYVGMFKEGVKDGFGKLQTQIYYYEGQFSQNQMSGNGSMTILGSNVKYFGSFANNKLDEQNSECVIRFPNGDVYTGETKNLLMHGKGVLHKNQGEIFTGQFENGQFKENEVPIQDSK